MDMPSRVELRLYWHPSFWYFLTFKEYSATFTTFISCRFGRICFLTLVWREPTAL